MAIENVVCFFFFMGLVGKKEKTVQKNKGKKKKGKSSTKKTASIWNWRKECILRTAEFFLLHI